MKLGFPSTEISWCAAMYFKKLVVGPLNTNCYIIGSEKTDEAVIVDPGGEPEKIFRSVVKGNLRVKYIVATHAHFDHVGGVKKLKESISAPFLIHAMDLEILKHAVEAASWLNIHIDKPPEPDGFLDDGDLLEIGELRLKVLFTPGHSPGSLSFFFDKRVLTGDLLFYGSVGRTDIPGGSSESLLKSIEEKIIPLGDDVEVYPGHGPETTVGFERRFNSFLRGTR